MSPAAVGVRSPVISPPPECSSATLQNPELEPQVLDSSFSFPAFCTGDLQGDQQGLSSLSCSDLSGLGLMSASNSQRVARSRPRLVKVRKRVASQHARSKAGACEVSSSFGNGGCSNDETVFSGDASNFDSGFVFGANRSDSVSNSNSGESIPTDNVQKKSDTGKLDDVVFVSGAKLSYRASSSDYKYEESRPNSGNLVADDGVKKKAEWKGEKLKNAEKLNFSSGTMKMDSVTIASMNNSVESVSGVDTINLSSTFNAEEGELGKSVGKAGNNGCSNCKPGYNDWLKNSFDSKFVFGNSWIDATTNVGRPDSNFEANMKAESISEFQKAEASNVGNYSCEEGSILKEVLGRDVFVFGSSSLNDLMEGRGLNEKKLNSVNVKENAIINVTSGNLKSNSDMNQVSTESNNISESVSGPKTKFTLPDEMKNLNINESGNINGYEKECSNATEKPSGSSNGYGKTNCRTSEGLAGSIGRTFEDNPENSGKSKVELQSGCEYSSTFVGRSSTQPFNFQAGCSVSCDECQFPRSCVNDTMQLNNSSTTTSSSFSSASFQCQFNDNPCGVPLADVGKNDENCSLDTSNNFTSTEFKIPHWDPSSFKENLFSDLNQNSVSGTKSKLNKTKRSKKTRGNLRQTNRQDKVSKENDSSLINLDSPGSCTPMDFSPYQETISVDQFSRDMSCDSSHLVNSSAPWTPHSTAYINEKNGVFVTGRKVTDGIWKHCETNEENGGNHRDVISVPSFEGFDSRNDTVCSSPRTQQCCSSDFAGVASTASTAAFNSMADTLERKQSGSEDTRAKSFTFSASSAIQSSISTTKSRHRKKNVKKSNHDVFVISPSPDIKFGSSFEFSPIASSSSHSETANKLEAEEKFKQGHSFSTSIQEICEKWRLRGNQAYKNGDLLKAEDLYTQGIESVPPNEGSASCLNSLMICFSNRAATRMSLGKIREALGDCEVASELDPNFLKVQVRAANCHLLLGETESAIQYFNKCLGSRDGICLDRRMMIEAADGLQKAQKVAECTRHCSELMEQKTDDAALIALDLIAEAVSISLYSEKLLEMKAEALIMLQRYEEAIKLCEQSLCFAEKNCIAESANVKTDVSGCRSSSLAGLWRCCLITRALFYLGKFEAALDTVGKLEQEELNEEKSRIKSLESTFTLADTIRELLRCKSVGNEAFRSGKYAEAVEHYTGALSINVQSRSFTAVCLCNRAASYQALGQIADAIADCNLAIALDENYSKAFSRRANLHEMIRDYGQAASDLQKFIFIVENKSDDKVERSGTPARSIGSVELKKARRNMPLMEEAAKKEISLNLYLILGVKVTDTASDIKKAYRKAALRHHPDKAGLFLVRSDSSSDGRLWKEISQDVYRDSDRLFKIIGEAYAVLSDPSKRSQYDFEEETRKAAKESKRGSNCRRSSNAYASPFEGNANPRNFRNNWKTWESSNSRW